MPNQDVSRDDVATAQAAWARAIVRISAAHAAGGDAVGEASEAIRTLYAFHDGPVLFKPTKARRVPFRSTAHEALSYFVGGAAVARGVDEDDGFAIQGGRGWSAVAFENHVVRLDGTTATAMGTYTFTCAQTRAETRAHYTFGYRRSADGAVRIFLHHSSLPPPA